MCRTDKLQYSVLMKRLVYMPAQKCFYLKQQYIEVCGVNHISQMLFHICHVLVLCRNHIWLFLQTITVASTASARTALNSSIIVNKPPNNKPTAAPLPSYFTLQALCSNCDCTNVPFKSDAQHLIK